MLAQLGEEGNIDFDEFDLSKLLNDNIFDFKAIAPDYPLTQQITDHTRMLGSEKYMSRFIQNALTNIRLHTPIGTQVRIILKIGKEITLVIEDSGAGLPDASYGEKIRGLKRFDRSRSRESGGTGLGLSIMSAVIERHNGVFNLRKSELGGLAIEVQLPRA
jgi:signal transduction histidine kinase